MKSGRLIVIGNKRIVNIFELLGSKGIVIENQNDSVAIDYVQTHFDRIGGALITSEFGQPDSKIVKKLNSLEIPYIVLNTQDDEGNGGYGELERLAEKAIGLKVNF